MNELLDKFLSDNRRTQKWLAEQVPCREATVSGWQSGITPRPHHMQRVNEITAGAVPVSSWFPASVSKAAS